MKRTLHILLILVALVAAVPAMAQDDQQTHRATLEVKGLIEAFDGTRLTVGGQTYDISSALVDDDALLEIGAPIEIKLVQRDGAWVVTSVDDEDTPVGDDAAGELNGILEAADGTILIISGVQVDITGAIFEDALVIGMPVEAYVLEDDDGIWDATRIEDDTNDDLSDDELDEDFELVGMVDDVGDDYIVVNGETVQLDDDATDDDDDYEVGDRVAIEVGTVDGELVAFEIETLDDDDLLEDRDDLNDDDDDDSDDADDADDDSASGGSNDNDDSNSGSNGDDDDGNDDSNSGNGDDDDNNDADDNDDDSSNSDDGNSSSGGGDDSDDDGGDDDDD